MMIARVLMVLGLLTAALGMADDLDVYKQRLAQGDNPGQLVSQLQQQVKTQPDNSELLALLVQAAQRSGDLETAISQGRKVVPMLPKDARVRYYLAMALQQKMSRNPPSWMMGKKEFITLMQDAIEIEPGFASPYVALAHVYINLPGFLGGSTKTAHQVLDQLKQHDPQQSLLTRVVVFKKEGKADAAHEALSLGMRDYPQDARFAYRYGMQLQEEQKYQQALTTFATNINRDQPHMPSLYQSARTKILGNFQLADAVSQLERYLAAPETAGDRSGAWWRKGNAHEGLQQHQLAKQCYETALKQAPDFKQAQKSLKHLEAKMGS